MQHVVAMSCIENLRKEQHMSNWRVNDNSSIYNIYEREEEYLENGRLCNVLYCDGRCTYVDW